VSSAPSRVAETMNAWFHDLLGVCDHVLFDISTDERHRKAATLNVLARNAKVLIVGEVDERGDLFLPLCFTLAAACRRLDVEPNAGQWLAAVENVISFGPRMDAAARALPAMGLRQMSAAMVFKQHLDEALVNAGVTDRPTILDQRSRVRSLGLAVNWGMRFLLSYAQETSGEAPSRPPDARDLPWIRALLAPLSR
jgi:hypothetical protein